MSLPSITAFATTSAISLTNQILVNVGNHPAVLVDEKDVLLPVEAFR